jgi:hypothetical protein
MDLTCYGPPPTKHLSRLDDRSRDASKIELTGDAIRLMVALEGKTRLQELATKYPRVLNRIAAVWNSPSEAERCFDELLLHSRGVRQGFPQPVINELSTLRHHYVKRVFPRATDPWDQSFLR